MSSPSLLKLMYLVSPALPVGAYAYSQGQEYALDAAWVTNVPELIDWVDGVMRGSVGRNDLPVLSRQYRAWEDNDDDLINHWNQFLRASRETKELLLEDEQLGVALGRVLETHALTRHNDTLLSAPSFVTLFALAGVEWKIPLDDLMQGFLWSWLENQISVATKSMPLGQTQAQQILMVLQKHIPEICDDAMLIAEEDIGTGLPGLAMASCLHEQQYSRLFRS